MSLPTTLEQRRAEAAESQDLAAEWRRVAVWGYAVIDQALDCSPSEAHAILLEAVAALEGAIDELDGRPA